MRLLKHEFYRIGHNYSLWAIAAAVSTFGVLVAYMGQRNIVGAPAEVIVPRVLANPLAAMWAGVVLAPLYIGLDFQNRTLNSAICAGYSRVRVLAAKTLCYYIVGALTLVISTICAVWTLHGSFPLLGEGFGARLALVTLIDCATLTFPLIFSCLFRDLFVSMAVSAVFTFTMQQLTEKGGAIGALRYYPAYLQADLTLWAAWRGVSASIFSCLICIIAGLFASFLLFNRRELK